MVCQANGDQSLGDRVSTDPHLVQMRELIANDPAIAAMVLGNHSETSRAIPPSTPSECPVYTYMGDPEGELRSYPPTSGRD